jgi:hypothetical protein
MTNRPDWLDDRTTRELAAVFCEHGVADNVSVIPTTGDDEAVFLVGSSSAAHMGEAALTAALTERLRRKVSITTDGSAWRETPIPLLPG